MINAIESGLILPSDAKLDPDRRLVRVFFHRHGEPSKYGASGVSLTEAGRGQIRKRTTQFVAGYKMKSERVIVRPYTSPETRAMESEREFERGIQQKIEEGELPNVDLEPRRGLPQLFHNNVLRSWLKLKLGNGPALDVWRRAVSTTRLESQDASYQEALASLLSRDKQSSFLMSVEAREVAREVEGLDKTSVLWPTQVANNMRGILVDTNGESQMRDLSPMDKHMFTHETNIAASLDEVFPGLYPPVDYGATLGYVFGLKDGLIGCFYTSSDSSSDETIAIGRLVPNTILAMRK